MSELYDLYSTRDETYAKLRQLHAVRRTVSEEIGKLYERLDELDRQIIEKEGFEHGMSKLRRS